MADKEFGELFRKYLSDEMTQEDLLRWKQLMQDDAYGLQLEALLDELVEEDQSPAGIDAPSEKMYRIIAAEAWKEKQKTVRIRSNYMRWAAAAAILLLVGAGIFVLISDNKKIDRTPPVIAETESADMAPGSNGAVLTLASGKRIVLDSIQNGAISLENNGAAYLENGALRYDSRTAGGDDQLNTITTARGRQFQVLLPDGSRAWLNAASSLTYPTRFSTAERNVQVTGEVYFEVAKQKDQPFKVQTPGQSFIEVTGTSFNVNAYDDEAAITTTLTAGAVNIHSNGSYRPLRAGQQAEVKAGLINVLNGADTSLALAWKNGVFDMNNVELPAVMRQLARWYDVNIEYEKQPAAIRFGGKMQRNLKLSQVLNGLSGMGVQFRIEQGRRLIVY